MSESTPLVAVRLVGLPVAIHRRAGVHMDTLRRELALVRVGAEADASARLAALSAELEGRYGGLTTAQRAALDEAGDQGTIDLVYELPTTVAEDCERLAQLLDALDELCSSGELVTLVTPPDALAYRRWFLGEFIGQTRDGREPVPWATYARECGFADDGGAAQAEPVEPPAPPAPAEGPPLVVDGDLDLVGAPALRAAVAERLEAGQTVLVVDLTGCEFIDSVGLSLLLTTRERCTAAGGSLTVVGAGAVVLQLFETVGVKELLVRQ